MPKDATPHSPWRALAIVSAIGLAAGVALFVIFSGDGGAEQELPDAEAEQAPFEMPEPGKRAPRAEVEYPRLRPEEAWVLRPDDDEIEEIVRHEFESLGGLDFPGSAPESARRELNTPGWASRMEEELRESLFERVMVSGVRLDRVECQRGRCLVELKFLDMVDGIGRVDALRGWARESVRCRVYSEGPDEGESPATLPSQQIWVLCGEPEAKNR